MSNEQLFDARASALGRGISMSEASVPGRFEEWCGQTEMRHRELGREKDLWAGRGETSAHWNAWRGHCREAGLHVGALTWPKLRFREERGLSVGFKVFTEFTPPFQKLVLRAQNFGWFLEQTITVSSFWPLNFFSTQSLMEKISY